MVGSVDTIKSLIDTPLHEILEMYPRLANMTPRQIAHSISFFKCRLSIDPGHACGQQLPFVTFKSVVSQMGSIFVLDSCLWHGEHWVIKMDLLTATLISLSPLRLIQNTCGTKDKPIFATILCRSLCQRMEILPAVEYLEIVRSSIKNT